MKEADSGDFSTANENRRYPIFQLMHSPENWDTPQKSMSRFFTFLYN